jgi:hypothetical protein
MQPATLAGIPGAGEVRVRRRSEEGREYRGVFAFPREHEAGLVELLASREPVEYLGMIDGERRCLRVRLTDLSRTRGMAYFQGLGEPYDESAGARVG